MNFQPDFHFIIQAVYASESKIIDSFLQSKNLEIHKINRIIYDTIDMYILNRGEDHSFLNFSKYYSWFHIFCCNTELLSNMIGSPPLIDYLTHLDVIFKEKHDKYLLEKNEYTDLQFGLDVFFDTVEFARQSHNSNKNFIFDEDYKQNNIFDLLNKKFTKKI